MESRLKIAVIAPTVPEELFDLLWEGICSAAFELSSFGVTVQSFKTSSHDYTSQSELLFSLLDSQFSAIAIVPAHPEALDKAIECHWEQRRPVVTFHVDAPASKRYSYVGTSGPEAGALAGEALAKFMGGRGELATFPGDFLIPQLAQRYQGFRGELDRWGPELKEVVCYQGLENLPSALNIIIERHPNLGGLFMGSARTFVLAKALAARGLRIPFVGFDNTEAVRPYLRNGTVSAVIDESVHQQGYIAVQRAYEVCVNQASEPSRWVRVPSSLVLAANSSEARVGETLNEAFEQLIRQQTAQLRSYQEMLESANRKLIRLAETDGLTGLLNRRKFEEVLPLELEKARVEGPVSLLMLDVDAFKSCNDEYGHHVGDEALRIIARTMRECARDADYCARLGGDEFCLLLPQTNFSGAEEVRDRICASLKRTNVLPGATPLFVQVSIGTATFPDDAGSADDLIIAADRSMYDNKRRARNRLHTAGVNPSLSEVPQ